MSTSPDASDFPALRLAEAVAAAVDRAVREVLGHPCPLFSFHTDRRKFLYCEAFAHDDSSPVEISIRVFGSPEAAAVTEGAGG